MSESAEKQFLYKLRAKRVAMMFQGPNEQEVEVFEQHFNYLKDLTDRGVVILAGRTQNNDESAFAIVILRAESEEAARAIMINDPAVKRGVMGAQLFPYRVAHMAAASA